AVAPTLRPDKRAWTRLRLKFSMAERGRCLWPLIKTGAGQPSSFSAGFLSQRESVFPRQRSGQDRSARLESCCPFERLRFGRIEPERMSNNDSTRPIVYTLRLAFVYMGKVRREISPLLAPECDHVGDRRVDDQIDLALELG